ncbi:membrane protein [Jannaschia sp. AI_61]|nr:membrane protein [Jannaschia sp. AI_61]
MTGLIVIAPIGLTFWLIWSVIGWIDGWVLPFVPLAYRPDIWLLQQFGLDVDIRGIGVGFFLLFTLLVGWMAKGLIGRSIIRYAENLVQTMPVVRSVYGGLKQIAETILAQDQSSFEKACLVEYPRKGLWAIAFISTSAKGEVKARAAAPMMSVFLPTTPNPTSGFLLFVPEEDVVVLDMSVEDAAKLVISAGLVYPAGQVPDDAPASARALS